MKFNDEALKRILLEGSYVEQKDLDKAEVYAKEHRSSLVDNLLSEGLLSRDILGQAIAESYGVKYADLDSNGPTKEQVLLIPQDVAKKARVVVFAQKKTSVTVATDDPTRIDVATTLQSLFPGKKITLAFALPDDLDAVFANYYQGLEASFAKIAESKGRAIPEIIDHIIEDALLLRASDIHCEPSEKTVMIRFRIDGVLHDAGEMPREYYDNIVNRLKVQVLYLNHTGRRRGYCCVTT